MKRVRMSIVAILVLSSATIVVSADQPARPATAARSIIDLDGMDRSVKPSENFYQFANGKWDEKTPIPADRPMVASFTVVQDRNRAILHQILADAAKDTQAARDSIVGKVGAFYRSGMDEARIEAAGATPLKEEFDRIDAMQAAKDIVPELARLHSYRVPAAFFFYSSPDLKNSRQMIAVITQSGLGLPDRDFYLKTDEKTVAIRTAYLRHIEKQFMLLGDAPERAATQAKTILEFETRLAKVSRARVDMRDPRANYNLMSLSRMESELPGFDWKAYFRAMGQSSLQELNVGQPAFVKEVAALVASAPLDDWKSYLRWSWLSSHADLLSAAFEKEDFNFRSTVLRGVPQMRPRWERVLEATDQLLGEALGQLYVAKAFPPEAKARAEALVLNVKAMLRERLANLDWMSPPTRKEALKKLDAIVVKIGYPSKWRDYSGLAVDGDVYVVNALQAAAFRQQQDLAKIGKPVDPTEWSMTPPTVNAYYNPSRNEIVFPAGILQPPFFDPNADDALNYGAVGSVIGHELTHGFDDQGRQFDADGNLRDWWSPRDAQIYKMRAEQIAKQYDGYVVVDNRTINGKLTLGENIADLGGLKISYLAFQKLLRDKPALAPKDGFTPEQRFFLAYGQLWRVKRRPETMRMLLTVDPHSPARFRVLGPLYNTPEFFQAFGITPEQAGAQLNQKPVQIW